MPGGCREETSFLLVQGHSEMMRDDEQHTFLGAQSAQGQDTLSSIPVGGRCPGGAGLGQGFWAVEAAVIMTNCGVSAGWGTRKINQKRLMIDRFHSRLVCSTASNMLYK